MPTQKTFKRRVRTRMTKTGESYAAARAQLLRKADATEPEPTTQPEPAAEGAPEPAPERAPEHAPEAVDLPTSNDAVVRASGRTYDEWFALLDAWGGSGRRHPEIASWLASEHGVDGWWSQSITVAYERARRMRAVHEMPGGFQVGASRTVAADAARGLEAFVDPDIRTQWLPNMSLRQRPTTAADTARFDWPDPPSRLVVAVTPRGPGRTTVAVQHEKLPDAVAAERQKADWRERLGALKTLLEGDPGPARARPRAARGGRR